MQQPWDSFPDDAENTVELSIPFVGFLRMQQQYNYLRSRGASFFVLSIPFVGFLRMQLIIVIKYCYRVVDRIALSIPFVGFLRMQPSLIRLSFRELGG